MIIYKMNPISYWLARWFVKLPYFGLANIAAGQKVAPEFLQHEVNQNNLVKTAKALLSDNQIKRAQQAGWAKVRDQLGHHGAIDKAAQVVIQLLHSKKAPSFVDK